MRSNIFIPKIINVGYQKRSGTYTGKLAYIIYYDENKKLRKEASWSSWRDEKIPNDEFDNIPTTGFVLNKKVGDYDSGWNHRQAYCRIYDPRNFEFEITIENLLYILENANSIKGKGLEGEFVYGWDGKDLILIPVESPDYKEIVNYNAIVHNKETIKARDLIIGATYLTKNNEEEIYMGKFDYYSYGYRWLENGKIRESKNSSDIPRASNGGWCSRIEYDNIDILYGKYFWFAYKAYDYSYVNGECVYSKTNYKWEFEQIKSLSKKFIKCNNEKCREDYSDIYEVMISKSSFSPKDSSKDKFIGYTFDEFKKLITTTEIKNKGGKYERVCLPFDSYYNMPEKDNFYFRYDISLDQDTGLYIVEPYDSYNGKSDDAKIDYYKRFNFKDIEIEKTYSWQESNTKKQFIPITLEELYKRLQPCYKETYLKNDKLYGRTFYYGDK